MNFRKGAFRLWVVLSVLFVVIGGGLSYSTIHEEFIDAHMTDEMNVPVVCADAVGANGTDYKESQGVCYYTQADFRRLYPMYKDLSSHDLLTRLYDKTGQGPLPDFHPWRLLLWAALAAAGIPTVVLLLGWALFWVAAGLKQSSPR